MSIVYIVFARFDRLSFARLEQYIRPAVERMKSFTENLDFDIGELLKERKNALSTPHLSSATKVCCFFMAVVVIIPGSAILLFLSILRKVFVNLLIGWKGLNLGGLSSMFEKFNKLVEQLTGPLQLPPYLLEILLYPFVLIYQLADLSNINALYNLLTVTCQGAKAPIELFIDSFVLGAAILFIKSNYNFLWAITFQEMNKLSVVKMWLEIKKILSVSFIIAGFVLLVSSTNPFMITLRYFLSYVNIGAFFVRDRWTHSISEVCIGIKGFQNQELHLVFATSILVWLLIPPMVYSTAEIVCPNGGYTSTSTLVSLFGAHQHGTDIVTPLLDQAITQDEYQLRDNMASVDVGSNLVSDPSRDNGIPVDVAPRPMEASPGRGGGDVEDVEISEDASADNDISVGANNQLPYFLSRLHRHAWPYVSFVCSADLFIVYAINAYLNRCQKRERISKLRHLRANQRWRTENIQHTIERFHVERTAKFSWHRFLQAITPVSTVPRREAEGGTANQQGSNRLPPYYRLCFMVQEELCEKIRIVYTLRPIAKPLSYLLAFSGIGQFFTIVGRANWLIVILKLCIFSFACMGIWTDETYEAYDIEALVKEFSIANPDEATMEFLQLTIASRVILLQALGDTTTLISIIVVNICGAQLFVFSPKLRKNIPPLLHLNPREVALKREKAEEGRRRREQQGNIDEQEQPGENFRVEEWVIILRSLSILLTESRLIVFMYNFVALSLTVSILKGIEISTNTIGLLLLAMLPYYVGSTLIPILYIGKRLNLTDEDFRVLSWLCVPYQFCRSAAAVGMQVSGLGRLISRLFHFNRPQRVHAIIPERGEDNEDIEAEMEGEVVDISMPIEDITMGDDESIYNEYELNDMEEDEDDDRSIHIVIEGEDDGTEAERVGEAVYNIIMGDDESIYNEHGLNNMEEDVNDQSIHFVIEGEDEDTEAERVGEAVDDISMEDDESVYNEHELNNMEEEEEDRSIHFVIEGEDDDSDAERVGEAVCIISMGEDDESIYNEHGLNIMEEEEEDRSIHFVIEGNDEDTEAERVGEAVDDISMSDNSEHELNNMGEEEDDRPIHEEN